MERDPKSAGTAPERRRGFTLIEILVVVCVITILIGLTASATFSARQKAYVATATTEAEQIAAAFKAYRLANEKSEWPWKTDGGWDSATKQSLGELLGETTYENGDPKPVFLNVSDDQFEDGEFRDPWGNAYQIRTFDPGSDNSGEAGEIELQEVVEVVVSFPNQYGRYYEIESSYVDPDLSE